ncbi:hypothetical protein [Bradyrhizobium altum]|uniref:hypothetical protein n=1 Tax=Bradyrhizobium altum TaxID=1571202 RepID=UPI001E4ABA7A|nr:hypothetical protein [Bradyrhizobium altum]
MAYTLGYFRWSWTLRADLVSDLVCRLIEHMRQEGRSVVEPTLSAADADMPRLPWMSSENFNAGYVMRAQHHLFRQGDRHPWKHQMEYAEELSILPALQPNDEALAYR